MPRVAVQNLANQLNMRAKQIGKKLKPYKDKVSDVKREASRVLNAAMQSHMAGTYSKIGIEEGRCLTGSDNDSGDESRR